jgi:hypothetical protein
MAAHTGRIPADCVWAQPLYYARSLHRLLLFLSHPDELCEVTGHGGLTNCQFGAFLHFKQLSARGRFLLNKLRVTQLVKKLRAF